MRVPLLFFLTLRLTNSLVDFTNSALYDIYDFRGVHEVHITKCDNGCLIFAATMGETFVQFPPDNLDPYASNIFITDNSNARNTASIAKLAQRRDNKNKKIPLTITGQGNISVVNLNPPQDEWAYWTIVLYVIEKTRAEAISYEVYDYYYSRAAKIRPQADIVTILSAHPFRIQAEQTNLPNSVTARLVGFDNALDNNNDECPYAYKTPESSQFPGFSLILTPQIVSLVIGSKNPIELQLDIKFNDVRDLAVDGFISSPGWNGCSKPNNGGFQSFRAREGLSTDSYILSSAENDYNVTMDVLPNFDATHKLVIAQVATFEKPIFVTGTAPMTLNFPGTHYLLNEFMNMKDDQGFLLRYSSTLIPKSSTESSPTLTSVITSPTQSPPTTSSSYIASGFMLSLFLISLLF